jgi:hypothetical protein
MPSPIAQSSSVKAAKSHQLHHLAFLGDHVRWEQERRLAHVIHRPDGQEELPDLVRRRMTDHLVLASKPRTQVLAPG